MASAGLKSRLKWWAFALGLGLTAAAIVLAVLKVEWSNLQQAQPWQLAVLLAAVAVNLLLAAALWWAVTLSFDADPKVAFAKMYALVCASALLNYLPLRPGLVGRSAYLKFRHKLPLRQSGLMVLVMLALAGLVLGAAIAIVQFVPDAAHLWAGGAVALLLTVLVPIAARRLLRRPIVKGWLWVPLRIADVLVTGLRLWVAFKVVGYELTYSQAVMAAAAGLFVSLIGITPNGLGLREWAIAGITAPLVGPAGFAAAVIDRGIEAIVITTAGLLALRKVSLREEALKVAATQT